MSESQSALLNGDQFLYFNSNATGWTVGDANRLKSTSDPAIFTLSYQVTQPWLVSSPDQGSFKLTNQLDGYGTSQTAYADRAPSVALAVPAADMLVPSSANLAVRYPSLGSYVLTVDWSHNTFSIAPTSGIIGDCGIAPRGSDGAPVDYVLVYESSSTRWCVDRDFWSQPGNASAIQRFYAYGDTVYAKLQSLFHITPGEKFTYQVTDITGGAHTGSDFGLGDTTTGDAFGNVGSDPVTGAPLPGFWGYLLTLHEGINDFTGLVTPGWPSDWWADLTQSLFIASGVSQLDTGIGPYTVDPAAVRGVGNAHCSIARPPPRART